MSVQDRLRRAGLVSTRRDGKRVVYRLADDAETDIVSGRTPAVAVFRRSDARHEAQRLLISYKVDPLRGRFDECAC
jgi:DNA-binding transcriptional ArsR family regulator